MNTFSNIIKSIFGRFWLQLWQDSWLIQGLIYIYSRLLYPTLTVLINNIYKQASVSHLQFESVQIPYRILLRKQSTSRKAIKTLNQLSLDGTSLDLQTSQSRFSYDIVQMYQKPTAIYTTPMMKGCCYQNFQVVGNVLYTPVDFNRAKVTQVLYTSSDSIFTCYQLWGIAPYISPLLDNFSAIAKVPSQWAIKYPRAIQCAWHIRQFGATASRVRQLISCICQCPIADRDGVVTQIKDNYIYINNIQYKCWDKNAILVHKGDRVRSGQPLCTYKLDRGSPNAQQVLRIYSGDTPSSDIVPMIPVLTSAGILYAQNMSKYSTNNILPLSGDADKLHVYRDVCTERNADQHVPYADVPAQVNPMQFLLQQVWGAACILIVIPAGRNQTDLQKALSCVLQNIPVGTICIVYQIQEISQPIQLNLTAQNQALVYYSQTEKVSLCREVNQWVV